MTDMNFVKITPKNPDQQWTEQICRKCSHGEFFIYQFFCAYGYSISADGSKATSKSDGDECFHKINTLLRKACQKKQVNEEFEKLENVIWKSIVKHIGKVVILFAGVNLCMEYWSRIGGDVLV